VAGGSGAASPAAGAPAPASHEEEKPSPAAQDDPDRDLARRWADVVTAVMGRKALLGAVLQHCTPVEVREGALVVSMAANPFHTQQLADRGNRDLIGQAIQQHVPGARRLEVSEDEGPGSGAIRHPAVQAALAALGGEVVAVRPRAPERRTPEEGASQ
jgi:hypothetical protein